MNLNIQKKDLVANIIIDKTIIVETLHNMNKTEEWLEQQLKIKGYKNTKKILLATLDINDKLIIYEKNDNIIVHEVLE